MTARSLSLCSPKQVEDQSPSKAENDRDSLPDEILKNLPLHCERIPSTISSLQDSALHQIQILLQKEEQDTLTTDEENSLDDGFMMCDLSVIYRKMNLFCSPQLFPRIRPFYAVKCNPDPMVTSVIGQMEEGAFDCASWAEIDLALRSGAPPTRIVYANPQRSEVALDESLRHGIRALTFDGVEELEKIHRAYMKQKEEYEKGNNDSERQPPLPPNVILRLQVPDTKSLIPLGEKFGAHPDAVHSLVSKAIDLDLSVIGVSFHCGSGNHSPEAYVEALKMAHKGFLDIESVYAKAPVEKRASREPCWLLDIGGGFPGRDGVSGDTGRFCGANTTLNDSNISHNDDESTVHISNGVRPVLDELFPADSGVTIIAEPGRYMVEAAFCMCSRIYRAYDEIIDGNVVQRHYCIAHGVQGVFKDCVLCDESFCPIPLSLSPPAICTTLPSTVHGPTGEPPDTMCRDHPLPTLQVGDWLLFDRMGAYSLSISSRSNRPPVRYVAG